MIAEQLVLYCQIQIQNCMAQLQRGQLDTTDPIYYSQVQKQSQHAITTNKRLLLMVQDQFICYLSSPSLTFPMYKTYIQTHAKAIVPLKQMHRFQYRQNNMMQLYFWIQVDGKRVEKSWVIGLANKELLLEWQDVFQEYTNRSRNGTLERKNTREIVGDQPSPQPQQQPQPQPQEQHQQHYIPYISPEQRQIQDQVMRQLAESAILLNEDTSHHSYLQSLNLPYHNNNLQYSGSITTSNQSSRPKLHSAYFHGAGNKFKNYFRPVIDSYLNSHIHRQSFEQIDRMYLDFLQYSKNCVMQLLNGKLHEIVTGSKGTRGWVRYEDLGDVVIDFGLTQLRPVGGNSFVCDRRVSKYIGSMFKNMNYVWEVVAQDQVLSECFKMPMSCIGAITAQQLPKQRFKQTSNSLQIGTSQMFDRLAVMAKVEFAMLQDPQSFIFVPANAQKTRFVIEEVRKLLPQVDDGVYLRQQALSRVVGDMGGKVALDIKHQLQRRRDRVQEHVTERVNQLADLMNKIQVYPIEPAQMAQILHSLGLNVKHLARILPKVDQSFARSLLKSEVALRGFKAVWVRRMEEGQGRVSEQVVVQLLNGLLGMGEGHVQLWRVVNLHCQQYFKVSVQASQINKGYFLLGLAHHLSIQIFPGEVNIDKMFEVTTFVQGVKFLASIKHPKILPSFLNKLHSQLQIPTSSQLFLKIISSFQLEQHTLPTFITTNHLLHQKVLLLLSLFIQPKNQKFSHLRIYDQGESDSKELGTSQLQRRLTEIRWEIRLKGNREYIFVLINQLRQRVLSHYGSHHPFISDLLDLQALYFLQKGQKQKVISSNRESLSNMVQCCGNNQHQLKLSNSHYQFGQCLSKCNCHKEALVHYKKAKYILQMNKYQNRPQYAHLLVKIGRVILSQYRDGESYDFFAKALKIYQVSGMAHNWNQLVEVFQLLNRLTVRQSAYHDVPLVGLQLAQHCIGCLQIILASEGSETVCSDSQLRKVLRIVIEKYLSKTKQQFKNIFRKYIIGMGQQMTLQLSSNKQVSEAVRHLKHQICQGTLLSHLQRYINSVGQILTRMKQHLPNSSFQRSQFLQNFQLLMRRLMVLCGDNFILNSIQ